MNKMKVVMLFLFMIVRPDKVRGIWGLTGAARRPSTPPYSALVPRGYMNTAVMRPTTTLGIRGTNPGLSRSGSTHSLQGLTPSAGQRYYANGREPSLTGPTLFEAPTTGHLPVSPNTPFTRHSYTSDRSYVSTPQVGKISGEATPGAQAHVYPSVLEYRSGTSPGQRTPPSPTRTIVADATFDVTGESGIFRTPLSRDSFSGAIPKTRNVKTPTWQGSTETLVPRNSPSREGGLLRMPEVTSYTDRSMSRVTGYSPQSGIGRGRGVIPTTQVSGFAGDSTNPGFHKTLTITPSARGSPGRIPLSEADTVIISRTPSKESLGVRQLSNSRAPLTVRRISSDDSIRSSPVLTPHSYKSAKSEVSPGRSGTLHHPSTRGVPNPPRDGVPSATQLLHIRKHLIKGPKHTMSETPTGRRAHSRSSPLTSQRVTEELPSPATFAQAKETISQFLNSKAYKYTRNTVAGLFFLSVAFASITQTTLMLISKEFNDELVSAQLTQAQLQSNHTLQLMKDTADFTDLLLLNKDLALEALGAERFYRYHSAEVRKRLESAITTLTAIPQEEIDHYLESKWSPSSTISYQEWVENQRQIPKGATVEFLHPNPFSDRFDYQRFLPNADETYVPLAHQVVQDQKKIEDMDLTPQQKIAQLDLVNRARTLLKESSAQKQDQKHHAEPNQDSLGDFLGNRAPRSKRSIPILGNEVQHIVSSTDSYSPESGAEKPIIHTSENAAEENGHPSMDHTPGSYYPEEISSSQGKLMHIKRKRSIGNIHKNIYQSFFALLIYL